jgi:hypothetical protein
MLQDVIGVECLTDYQLRLRFQDGVEDVIDISGLVAFTGMFAPLKDKPYLDQVRVDPDSLVSARSPTSDGLEKLDLAVLPDRLH